MTDERYKQIMNELGMPNSQSLLSTLRQVENEAGQEAMRNEREACAKECERYGSSYFAAKIRER